ncbi:unnamed protein product [Mytilus edulis]|uniref:TTF-type domain-containing protein n=1 Tax=Mytilus edulis TaxID=6550 RepID=A0A8S3QBI3_MYTED|nr:unnamed protein product [Mytilus edulis]
MDKFVVRSERKKDEEESSNCQTRTVTDNSGESSKTEVSPTSNTLSCTQHQPPYPDIGSLQHQQTIPDNKKIAILTQKWTESHSFKFPARKVLLFGKKNRRFQATWLKDFHWMRYSPSTDSVFCAYCVLFTSVDAKEKSFSASAITVWKNLLSLARFHENLSQHRGSLIAGEDFLRVKKDQGDSVASMISSSHKKVAADNRYGLMKIFVILLCGRQNIPIRGHVEERSNFIAILHEIARSDDKLSDWLAFGAGSRTTYLSPEIQNEIINIVGQQTVQEIAFKFDNSAKSLTAFTEELSENENIQDQLERRTKLRTLCETRWSSRADSLYTFRTAFEVVVSALNSLKDDNDDKAAQSMNAILRFEFIISLVVAEHILSATVALANYLQKTDIDLIESLTEAKSVIQRLPDERGDDTVWESLFTRATDIAAEHDIEPSVPRVAGRQRHRANHPIIEPSDYWRVSLYYVFLDHLVAEITKRLISNEERFLASYFIPAKLGILTPEIADKIYNSYRSDLGVISTTYQYCAIHNSGYEAIVSRSSKQLTSIDSCAWFCNDTNSFAVQVYFIDLFYMSMTEIIDVRLLVVQQIIDVRLLVVQQIINVRLLVVQQIIDVRLLVVQQIIDVRLLVVQQIINIRLLVVQQIINVRLLVVQQIIDVRLLVVQQIIDVRLLVVQQIIDVRLLGVQQIIDVRLLVVQQIINSTGSMMICECVFGSTNIIHHKVDDILCLPFTCKDENNDDKPCGMSQVMAVYSHDVTNFDSTRVMFSETEVNLADDDHSKPLTVEIGNGTSEDKIITGISISKINFAISNFTFEYSGESCSSSESFQRYTEFNPQMFDASTIHMIEPLRTSCLRLTIYPSDTTLPVNPRCRVILYKPSEDYVTADRIGIYGYYHDSTVDSSGMILKR